MRITKICQKCNKKMNKKGALPVLIWGGAALATGIALLVNALKPKPAPGSAESIISALPIWGWISLALLLLLLMRGR